VVATAMLAEFVQHSKEDVPLMRELIKFLLPRVADKVDKVRKQALRGLGNLVVVWSDEVAASATSILSALTSASEDPEAEVAAEAVASLTRVSPVRLA
jgi:vesicle coat complex subunit